MQLEQYEIDHIKKVRQIAPECMVLLKSDGTFPLSETGKIALYGCGARRTLKGGRGSGDVNVRAFTTIEQGLENAGFEVTTKSWLDAYETQWQKGREKFREWLRKKIAAGGMDLLMENLSIVMPEPEYELPLDGEGNTAIYVLSRLCGEGVDRQAYPGDLFLSQTEIRDILQLQKQYARFMLVLNTACVVDLSPVAETVQNILLLSQPGMTVGDSLADVLLGKAYPSGKLAVTWTAYEDYSDVGEFGDRNDTRYKEGVYVGYRYFDSIGKKPLFPFGFGLSYTTFAMKTGVPKLMGTKVKLPVNVKNTGDFAGKEVLQLYVSLPAGRLDQPYQVLAAFVKTPELLPGGDVQIELSFAMESLASYDRSSNCRILERGDYVLRVGSCSRDTAVAGIVALDADAVVEHVTAVGGTTDFNDWQPDEKERAQTRKMFADDKEAGGKIETISLSAAAFTEEKHHIPALDAQALAIAQSLTDTELAYLCTGDFVDEGSKSVIGDAAIHVAGAAGETTGRFKRFEVENLIMADGPAGLRLSREYGVDAQGSYVIRSEIASDEDKEKLELMPEAIRQVLLATLPGLTPEERHGEIYEQNCTAIPVAAALAQSWNVQAAQICGEIVGAEMERFGIDIWLAPAMNIVRHPLCGRNFEYYSEDPLISGKMAAAMTVGVQGRGQDGVMPKRCVTIKHFIANNQEANRFRTSSMINERALRDIYARGFEIAVKEARPMALMTSYNLVNGVHTCENRGLLQTLLREEWGYEGIVMSDFLTGEENESDRMNKYKKFNSVRSIKAGLDVLMPGGKAHYENMLNALVARTLTREEMESCAARMITFAWQLKGVK